MNPKQDSRILRQQLGVLRAEAADNEIKLRKFQDVELKLLTMNSLSELLKHLVTDILDAFKLESVGLVLLDPDHKIRHLLINSEIQPPNEPGLFFTDDLSDISPIYHSLRRPCLGPYLRVDHGRLFPTSATVRSVAVLPFFQQGSLVGSLNFGSANPSRYTRHHSADFLGHFAAVGAVCLENALNRERLLYIGLIDLVTGCHNRRYLECRLAEAVAEAQRYGQPLSCLFVDVDHFKRVNDIYGHAAGDSVLQTIGNRIKSQLRASDVLGRYGGEEFAVLLPQTALEDAVQQAERLRQAIASAPVSLENGEGVGVTVSIGVAELQPSSAASAKKLGDHLLATADAALYKAKAAGRNRVIRSEPTIHL